MKIAINKAHYPVTVLGHGKRIGIWVQGCSIGCKGCVSQDTWADDPEKEIAVDELVEWCRQVGGQEIDGITISGGEPFEQAEALSCLLKNLRRWTDELPKDVDFLCYSGLPYRTIQKKHPEILAYLDAIIPEPFVPKLPAKPLRGSSNQTVISLTPLGQVRYGKVDSVECLPVKRFQAMVDQDCVWFVGIPDRGGMDHVAEYCKERGVSLGGVSWRA